MINKIKVEYCEMEKDLFKNKHYTPVDITHMVNIPLLITDSLDETLDTMTFELDSKDKTPYKPFTKFIVRIYEYENLIDEPVWNDSWVVHDRTVNDIRHVFATKDVKGKKRIYYYTVDINGIISQLEKQEARYYRMASDNVQKLTWDIKPLFRHTINLVECTKELETIACDNMTSTHTLAEQAALFGEISSSFWTSEAKTTSLALYRGSGAKGYLTPARHRSVIKIGDAIRDDVRLDTFFMAAFWGIGATPWRVGMEFSSQSIQLPNGNIISTQNSPYIVSEAGEYIVVQRYEGRTGVGVGSVAVIGWAYWVINVVESFNSLDIRHSVSNVITRLLATNPTRREGLDADRFQLDVSSSVSYNQILSPEMRFTGNNLYENLLQCGGLVHAIPRLLSRVSLIESQDDVFLEDWQNWDIITYDTLGGDDNFNDIKNKTIEDGLSTIDGYSTDFVSYVENGLQTNAGIHTPAIEPFDGGFISARTESNTFVISDDTAVFKTSMPIYRILSVHAVGDNNIVDITHNVVEINQYNLGSSYRSGIGNKDMMLYYVRGGNIVDGLTFTRQAFLSSINPSILPAARNIMLGDFGINIISPTPSSMKHLAVRITYIPYRNFKARHFKPIIEDSYENATLIYNQQEQVVDIENLGENIKGALLRTGNPMQSKTFYYDKFEDIPTIGMVNNEGYYIYSISAEIYNTIYKCTMHLAKNYNKLNEFIGIKSDYRQFEISELETSNRSIDYNEFCIVANELDFVMEEVESNLNASATISDYMNSIGLTNIAILYFANKLSTTLLGSAGLNTEYSQLSWTSITTNSRYIDINGNTVMEQHNAMLPLSTFAFGNSIQVGFKTQENFSAGTTAIDIGDNFIDGRKGVQDFVNYSDHYGQFDTMSVSFGIKTPQDHIEYLIDPQELETLQVDSIRNYSKQLYLINGTINPINTLIDLSKNPLIIQKDNRESISFNYGLHFITNTSNIIIGKKLSEITALTGDTTTTLKSVWFKNMPNKLTAGQINSNTYDIPFLTMSSEFNNTYKFIRCWYSSAIPSIYAGWGLLTDKNELVVATHGLNDIYLLFRPKI